MDNTSDPLAAGDDFNATPCRQSYGISLDEQRPKLVLLAALRFQS